MSNPRYTLPRRWRLIGSLLAVATVLVVVGSVFENLVALGGGSLLAFVVLGIARFSREVAGFNEYRASHDTQPTHDATSATAASGLARSATAYRASWLASGAMAYVQDEGGGVRVQDWYAALAAMTGEAALRASGVLDIENTDLPPGSGIFGDEINAVLTNTDDGAASPNSVWGIMHAELVPEVVPAAAFPTPAELYQHVAGTVNQAPFGEVTLSVPPQDVPTIQPLRAAFELRPMLESVQADTGLEQHELHIPSTLAMCEAVRQAKLEQANDPSALDPATTMTLLLQMTFAMAKMVPMSRRMFEDATRQV